jgi:hypothetical protein
MKWMLVVMVFNTTAVKTDLVFSALDQCLKTEEGMRVEYTHAYNDWLRWAQGNKPESQLSGSEDFQKKRLGLQNSGVCIPHQ